MQKKVKSKALKWFSNFFEKLQLLLNDHTKLKPIFEILVNSEDEDILKKWEDFSVKNFGQKDHVAVKYHAAASSSVTTSVSDKECLAAMHKDNHLAATRCVFEKQQFLPHLQAITRLSEDFLVRLSDHLLKCVSSIMRQSYD